MYRHASGAVAVSSALLGLVLLGGCTIPTRTADDGSPGAPAPAPVSATPTGVLRAVTPTPAAAPATSSTAPGPTGTTAPRLSGRTVFLDPGHNASSDPGYNGRQVPTGRGGTKDCQTSGTSTDDGYPEHTFTFDVAMRVKAELASQGVTVLLSRPDDDGAGPCVDERANAENASGADAVLSIHGDGAASSGHGFHVAYSAPPLNGVQGGPTIALADTVRTAMVDHQFTPSTYIGSGDALDPRSDLTGLNLATRPSVLVECGNMRNPADAAQLSSPDGRQRIADALTDALDRYLTR